MNLGAGLGTGRARLVAVLDSQVLLEAVSMVRFRSMLFMIVLYCDIVALLLCFR